MQREMYDYSVFKRRECVVERVPHLIELNQNARNPTKRKIDSRMRLDELIFWEDGSFIVQRHQ
jgi:hypothetical protein